jgi:hypothetical protein
LEFATIRGRDVYELVVNCYEQIYQFLERSTERLEFAKVGKDVYELDKFS